MERRRRTHDVPREGVALALELQLLLGEAKFHGNSLLEPLFHSVNAHSGWRPTIHQVEAHAVQWPQEDLSERRRAAIVATAYRVFADRGYREATIADIARALGIGHGTIYRYFANKRELLERVLDLSLERIVSRALSEDPSAATTAQEFHDQALRIGDRLLKVFEGDPGGTRLVLFESPSIDPALAQRVSQVLDRFAEVTARYLENGVRRGFLRPDLDIAASARAINGMFVARAVERLHGAESVDRRRFSAALGRLLLDGVRAPAGRAAR
jgi:AcrR family transcriptional regulator